MSEMQRYQPQEEQQPQRQQQQQKPSPSDSELAAQREQVINSLRAAISCIEQYKLLWSADPYRALYSPFENDGNGIRPVVEDELLPLFLGAPGEVCDACGGSGRKK